MDEIEKLRKELVKAAVISGSCTIGALVLMEGTRDMVLYVGGELGHLADGLFPILVLVCFLVKFLYDITFLSLVPKICRMMGYKSSWVLLWLLDFMIPILHIIPTIIITSLVKKHAASLE